MRLRFGRAGTTLALLVAPLLAAAACASRTGSAASQGPVIVVFDEREARLSAALGRHITVDERPVSDSLAAAPDRAHRALVTAYSALGIPEVVTNPTSGLVAIAEHRVRGTIARERPSRFLSCGATLTGARADEDIVVLTVVSRVKPAGPGASVVETRIVATATDTRGTGARQACSTTGQLELRLHQAAKQALGTPEGT